MSASLKNWTEEKQAAFLYEAMILAESDPGKKTLFSQLRQAAEKQAAIWIQDSREPLTYRPDLRTRLVVRLVRSFGPGKVRMILAAMKVRGLSVYLPHGSHGEGHPMPQSLEDVGSRHQGTKSAGNLRAAIFGINDGLVSSASLILGVAGAGMEAPVIILTGIAGILAGSLSMAMGEYISVRSQKEMLEYQIGLEKEELQQYPREEAAELALIYKARGLSDEEAVRLADKMIADPVRGLDTLAREELGINPDKVVSPLGACLSSFFAFALGGVIPLIPFLVAPKYFPLALTMGLTLTSLFVVGCLISLFTGRNALWSGLRMLSIGSGAGLVTYLIGKFAASF